MRKLLLPVLLGLSAAFTAPVHALTATGSFDVTVNLYPKCELGTISALALNYVSFQATDSVNTQSVSVKCTGSLPYTLGFAGTAGASGTLIGLNYTLATLNPSNVAATTGTGTGAAQTWKIEGTIAGNQGGTCATVQTGTTGSQDASVTGTTAGKGTACTATSASGAHTLTITY